MSTLELMANQAVTWAHTLERAVHDPGPWQFRTAAGSTPAHRIVDHERGEIVFVGHIRAYHQDSVVELWCGEELVSVMLADFTMGDRVTWKIRVTSAAQTYGR